MSQSSAGMAGSLSMSPMIRNWPSHDPTSLGGSSRNGLTLTTGRRCLVTTITVPVSCTSSIRRRQFVLNSPAGTTRSAGLMLGDVMPQLWSCLLTNNRPKASAAVRLTLLCRSERLRPSFVFPNIGLSFLLALCDFVGSGVAAVGVGVM